MNFIEPFLASTIELAAKRTDWPRYVELLESAAQAGDNNARHALGSICLRGNAMAGVAVDTARGLRLLRAASRTSHLAMAELATIYEAGEHGVRRSEKKAFELFVRAAAHGSIAARYHVGRCYFHGVGVMADRRKAAAAFRSAARLGFPVHDDHTSE